MWTGNPSSVLESTSGFLCDLGKMVAGYPRDVGRELTLWILYSSPCPVAGASGFLLLTKAEGLTYPIPKG